MRREAAGKREERILVANQVLRSFQEASEPVIEAVGEGAQLRVSYFVGFRAMAKPLGLDSEGVTLLQGNKLPWSGARSRALAQLVRFIRDLPRESIACWSEAVEAGRLPSCCLVPLSCSEYNDSAKTNCVLCGGAPACGWWHDGDCTGPVCSPNLGCRQLGVAK